MQLTAQELGVLLNGTVEGNPNVAVNRPSKIEEGGAGSISFLANPKYEKYAYSTDASILLVEKGFSPKGKVNSTLIRVENVYESIGFLLNKFGENGGTKQTIVAQNSAIHNSIQLPENVGVGDFSVIKEGAQIGEGTQIHSQVFIGKNATLGKNCILYPGVKIYHDCVIGDNCILHANVVIGGDGFGFVADHNGVYNKIAQVGNVVLENNVEVGANSTIDRATMGSTFVRMGVKIDNLVQIAHNVEIGENTVIASQAGIAGSTKIGKNCQIGGQVGFAGHLTIADGSKFQAQSGIASSINEPNGAYFGSPAINYRDFIRSYAVFKKLPELYKKWGKK